MRGGANVAPWMQGGCFHLLTLVLLLGVIRQAAGATYYPRQYQCAPYQPPACKATFQIGSDNKINYTAPYEEDCSSTHQCATPDVRTTAYTYNNGSDNIQVAPWFCSSASLAYPARVASATGLPPGKLEDQMAACAFANLRFGLLLEDCRDVQLWTCDDCLRAYKAWLCASLFPRCSGAGPDDGVTKPCLELCWTVSRRCPATQGIYCPINGERGDYQDGGGPPDCLNPAQQATQALVPHDAAPLAAQFATPVPLLSQREQADALSSSASS